MIPEISTPTRGAINTEAMALGGPSPGAVEWLNHAASFHYTTPAAVETLVEADEEHFSWWCRRCWEDRRTKEAAEAVKRQKTQLQLGRASRMGYWCQMVPVIASSGGENLAQ